MLCSWARPTWRVVYTEVADPLGDFFLSFFFFFLNSCFGIDSKSLFGQFALNFQWGFLVRSVKLWIKLTCGGLCPLTCVLSPEPRWCEIFVFIGQSGSNSQLKFSKIKVGGNVIRSRFLWEGFRVLWGHLSEQSSFLRQRVFLTCPQTVAAPWDCSGNLNVFI